jgi:hypothetical protein
MYISDCCIDRTINITSDVFRAVFWFIVVYNVKPLKGPMVRSLNPVAPLYFGDVILVVICINFSYFP